MATNIKTLKDVNGDIVVPRTRADAVTMADGFSNAETEINNKAEKPSLLTEATVLENTDLMTLEDAVGLKKISIANMKGTFADKAVAQMYKLTNDFGGPKSSWADLNTLKLPGVYYCSLGVANAPASYGVIQVNLRTDSQIFQSFHSTNNVVFTRVSNDAGATWTAWKEMADANNAIVESGTNASGRYVKFGDGTMICYKLVYYNVGTANTDMVITNPATFLGNDYAVNISPEGNSSIITSSNGKSVSSVTVRSNTLNCTLDIVEMGRWK